MNRDVTKHTDAPLRKNETRQVFLLKLSDALRPLADVSAIKATAMRLLGTQLNANRVAYFEITDDAYVVECDYVDGVPTNPGRHPIASFGSKLYETYCSGRTACDFDTEANPELSPAERARFAEMQTRAYIGLPLVKNGAFIAGLAIHSAKPRAWTKAEIDLAGEVAERTWAAVEQARAERSLAESEKKYHTLFDAMDEGYCIIDVLFDETDKPFDWRFIEVNPAFEKHSGVHAATGKTVLELIPDIEPKWFDMYGRVARTGESLRTVAQSAAINRWFNLYAFRVGEPGQNRVAVLFSEDTEGQQAEAASVQLAAIVESSDDAIISKDLNGTMQTWNAGAQQLFGYTAEETVGQSVTMLMPSERVHEEKGILELIGCGEHIDHFETVRQHKDGALLEVSLTISPIVDNTGTIVGASKIARDISERRRTERLQEHQTQLLELIAAGAPLEESLAELCLAMSQINSGVRASILIADAARTSFQRSIAPELHSSWHEGLAGAPINELMIGTCGEAVYRDQPITCEDVAIDACWSREWRELCVANGIMATYSVPIRDEDSEPVASFMLCFGQARGPSTWERQLADFGSHVASIALARNRSHEALRAADRRKDKFLATLAHELRNPLTPLRNGLEIIRRNEPEAVEKARIMMTRQLTRVTHLVDDLMDVSRVTHGKVALRMAPTDLAAVVQDAVENTRARVAAAGHTFRLALPTESVVLRADPDRLTQVFTNLLDNAIQYTPAGGRIELVLEQAENEAVVAVRDNGMGIAAERLGDIFDMFMQLDPPAGQINEGLGIGLTLVEQMVELHGGTIEARSEGTDCGAEFTVRLPLTADVPEEPVEPAKNQPAPTTSPPRRLLVVDDDHDVADALALMVECWGHETHIAHDGLEALDELPVFEPDAVLLDIGMPRLDGLETARRMRATPAGRDITLIALTGWGQPEDRNRTAEAGFDHHLVKPVAPDELEQLLSELEAREPLG